MNTIPLLWGLLRTWPAINDNVSSHLWSLFWVLARKLYFLRSSTMGLGNFLDSWTPQNNTHPHEVLATGCGFFFFLLKLLHIVPISPPWEQRPGGPLSCSQDLPMHIALTLSISTDERIPPILPFAHGYSDNISKWQMKHYSNLVKAKARKMR